MKNEIKQRMNGKIMKIKTMKRRNTCDEELVWKVKRS